MKLKHLLSKHIVGKFFPLSISFSGPLAGPIPYGPSDRFKRWYAYVRRYHEQE